MRVVFLMVITLVGGLSLGTGGMTLYWSGQLNKSHDRNAAVLKIAADWKAVAGKFQGINARNESTLRKCLDLVKTRS